MVGGPVLFGVLCGVLLGVSEPAYLAASVLAAVGGFLAGLEHAGTGEGAIRGVIGGSLFGASILIAHEIEASEATATLPDPGIVLVVLTAAIGAALGAVGGRVRARRQPSPPVA